jgi:hypothetical protein
VLVEEGKLACASLPPWWMMRFCARGKASMLVLVQEGKLACASFPPWQNDVVRDVLVLLQEGNPT